MFTKKNLFVFFSIIIFNFTVFAEQKQQTAKKNQPVKLIDIVGKVEVSKKENEWKPAKDSMELKKNDKVRTGKESSARIWFSDETISLIGADAIFQLQESSIETVEKRVFFKKKKIDAKKVKVKMFKGNIFSKVKKMNTESSFSVSTPTSVCGVRGTEFDINFSKDNTEVAVLDGEVGLASVDFPDEIIPVKKGEQSSAAKGKKVETPKPIPPEKLKKLEQKTKIVNKKVTIKLTPEFVGQSINLVKDDKQNVTYEYSVQIKNILADKIQVKLLLLNSKGEQVATLNMNKTEGNDDVQSVKTFKAQYTFKKSEKLYHKYKLINK